MSSHCRRLGVLTVPQPIASVCALESLVFLVRHGVTAWHEEG